MQLKSLGYRSNIIFTNFDGEVEDRGDYLVMRTLSNPNFFWGNLLIFKEPPQKSDYEKWTALFKKEFTDPRIYHITLAWDISDKEPYLSEFEKNDFIFEKNVVLAAAAVKKPPRFNKDLEVRPITKEDWPRMIEIQVEANTAEDSSDSSNNLSRHEWQSFYQSQSQRYKKMIDAGHGQWFGGFYKNQLVTGLGIFHDGEMGRYQIVSTHPGFTKKGFAATLVYLSALYALDKMQLKQLIMCADPDYHAARIYASVGFTPVHTDCGVYWWDKARN